MASSTSPIVPVVSWASTRDQLADGLRIAAQNHGILFFEDAPAHPDFRAIQNVFEKLYADDDLAIKDFIGKTWRRREGTLPQDEEDDKWIRPEISLGVQSDN